METKPSPPREAIAYLDAVRRYYAQPGVTREPRNADIAAMHVPRLEPRTWDRRKHLLRHLQGRDWLEVWPPPPDWRPSWEPMLPRVLPPDEDDGTLHLVYDEAYDRNGKLIERRLIRTLGHLGATAALWAYMALDLSDGRVDGVVRVTRFFSRVIDRVLANCHHMLT